MAEDKKTTELSRIPSTIGSGDAFYVVRDGRDYYATGDDIPGGAGAVSSVDGQTGAVVTGYDDRISALENVEPTASGSNLVSGGGVSLTGGLTLTVSAAIYNILGVAHSSDETILTADTADATHPRYDVVALDDQGDAVLITGTPAATPVAPTVDPATQLYVTVIYIPAGATSITGTETVIYDENDDWTMTESGSSVVLDSTNNPFAGTKCIEVTSMAAGDYFRAQKPTGTIDLGTFNVLRFRIRNKGAWHNSKQVTITARNNGTQVGQAVVFKPGLHAFDQANTSSYQHITINPNLFANGGQAINQLQWTCAGGGSAIPGFYIDDIVLQAGVAQSVDSTRLRDRGAHSTALQYDVNDLAYSGSVIYKALQQTPVGVAVTNTTYWAVFGLRSLQLPASLSDGQYYGTTEAGTAGATLAFGDLVYLAAADSRWELADADADSTSGAVRLGIVVLAAAADGDPTLILTYGKIRADTAFPSLTIGAPVYVSTTAGDLQTAQPSGTDDVIRIVGYGNTADELFFCPSNDYMTHT